MTDLEKNNDRDGSDENKKVAKNKLSAKGTYLAIGIAVGVAIGASMDNISIGIALGVAIGASMDAIADKNKKKQ
ncbi:hypothetical protein [Clostridium sp.]|uniref:hypothetical protein n=1 Tax=Clostridium sp. TaxID=1506 RepID=UPI003D6CEC2A